VPDWIIETQEKRKGGQAAMESTLFHRIVQSIFTRRFNSETRCWRTTARTWNLNSQRLVRWWRITKTFGIRTIVMTEGRGSVFAALGFWLVGVQLLFLRLGPSPDQFSNTAIGASLTLPHAPFPRHCAFDPRVLGASVESKLFGELGSESPLHFI